LFSGFSGYAFGLLGVFKKKFFKEHPYSFFIASTDRKLVADAPIIVHGIRNFSCSLYIGITKSMSFLGFSMNW
jgi:hypothetical protein